MEEELALAQVAALASEGVGQLVVQLDDLAQLVSTVRHEAQALVAGSQAFDAVAQREEQATHGACGGRENQHACAQADCDDESEGQPRRLPPGNGTGGDGGGHEDQQDVQRQGLGGQAGRCLHLGERADT